jgi:hypothetical protein
MVIRKGSRPLPAEWNGHYWAWVMLGALVRADPVHMAAMGYRYGYAMSDNEAASLRLAGQLPVIQSLDVANRRVAELEAQALQLSVAGDQVILRDQAKRILDLDYQLADTKLLCAAAQDEARLLRSFVLELKCERDAQQGEVQAEAVRTSYGVHGVALANGGAEAALAAKDARIAELEAEVINVRGALRTNIIFGTDPSFYAVELGARLIWWPNEMSVPRFVGRACRLNKMYVGNDATGAYGADIEPTSMDLQTDAPIPHKGDFVTCENGCLVCEVVDDRPALGAFRDEGAAKGDPDCACGARWWEPVRGVVHLKGRGWSAETRMPCWWLGNAAFPADDVANDASDAAYLYHGDISPRRTRRAHGGGSGG